MNKQKVLIVDDEPINIRLVATILQDEYQILIALSGEDALKLLKNELPDIILLDINMPQMDGFEVIKQLQNDPLLAGIPVIFLTGNNDEETIVNAFVAGAVDYILKPFQTKELEIRVKNHILRYTLQNNLMHALQNNTHLLNIIDEYVSFIKVDTDGIIQDISNSFCRSLQSSKEFMIGQNINILKSGNTPKDQYQELWKTITSGKTYVHDIEDMNFAGKSNWYQVTCSPDHDDDNNLNGYIAFYKNIDETMRFKKNSETDVLTGLPNRLKIDQLLMNEKQRFLRYQHNFSIILVDIDHFKEVNDNYGHQVGDDVLKEISNILSSNIRASDVVGRWGGEEFLVVCTHTHAQGAYALAEKLRQKLESHTFSNIEQKTASFGVAVYEENDTLESLFKKSDEALYRAKESGRNQVK